MLSKEEIELISEGQWHLNFIYNVFRRENYKSLVDLVNSCNENKEIRNNISYYFWIFREDHNLNSVINHKDIQNNIYLQYIYCSLGFWIASDKNPEDFFRYITQFISKEKAIQILSETEIMQLDLTLSLYLLSILDIEDLENFSRLPSNNEEFEAFIYEIFLELDRNEFINIFTLNQQLYSFLLNFIKGKKISNNKKLTEKYKEDFDSMEIIATISGELVNFLKKNHGQKNENFPVNIKKIEFIRNKLKNFTKSLDLLNILTKNQNLISTEEKEILRFLLSQES